MSYDEELAERVREVLDDRAAFGEIKMFGGLCFTVNGNMALGVVNDDLMVRVGPDGHDAAMAKTGAREMDFTHRPMKGFLFVGPSGTKTKRSLQTWASMALAFVEPMPPKVKAKRKVAPKR